MNSNAFSPSDTPHAAVESSAESDLRDELAAQYKRAEAAYEANDFALEKSLLGETFSIAWELGGLRHAARGIALTLSAYKVVRPSQDIRNHKAEHPNGFSARGFDSIVTVPFLQARSLPYNVETHWLSQTFSFAGPYQRGLSLKTQPRSAGPLMLEVVNRVQESGSVEFARAAATVLFARLIDERNRGKVALEKPKDLAIDAVESLLSAHFSNTYTKNGPRLPQLAMYAIYKCIVRSVDRYSGLTLGRLERLKAANRKSGSVGDIDVNRGEQPIEAVEVKHGIPINREHVAEAIQKIKTAAVERYFILSTAGVADGEGDVIRELQIDFKRSNGCEIIVNGVLETIRYYLRLVRSTTDFVYEYTTLVEVDEDLGYEHRLAWNEICATRLR